MQTPEDLFLIRRRIADDHDRARLENDARTTRRPPEPSSVGARIGRHLIAIGALLAPDAVIADTRRSTARPPC